jgi:hypothetical protein
MSRLRFNVTFDKVACGACGATLWSGDDTCDVCGTERRPGGEDDEQKLEELGLSLGSRLLVSRIQEVASLLAQGAGDPELDEKLDRAVASLSTWRTRSWSRSKPSWRRGGVGTISSGI